MNKWLSLLINAILPPRCLYCGKITNNDDSLCADCFDKIMEPHDHLLCDRCGKITDLKLHSLTESLEQEIGSEIEDYELTVHYVCPECRRAPRRR